MFEVAIDQKLIERAAKLLKEGQLVAFPTETVYGLGADASNPLAIKSLYEAKGRPSSHPVIVHLHSVEQIAVWATDLPDSVEVLARAFWPGPMTLVLKRAAGVLDAVTGGQDTVGLRIPNHPLALALLKEFGGGLVAPSANKFGRLSPTSAADVRAEFANELALVLDGGPCQVGIESTIIDLTSARPRILRPGMLSVTDVFAALGEKYKASEHEGGENSASTIVDVAAKRQEMNNVNAPHEVEDIRVPGSLASHYAPVTPLHLVPSSEFSAYLEANLEEDRNVAVISFHSRPSEFSERAWVRLPKHPGDFARLIYSTLRRLDALNPRMIILESPPVSDGVRNLPDDDWTAVNDRLVRAAFRP
jgi:L-threonylcarbamoyladenylate synthase